MRRVALNPSLRAPFGGAHHRQFSLAEASAAAAVEPVTVTKDEGVATVILNNSFNAANVLTMETIESFRSKFAEIEAEPGVTAAVITAEKTGIFSGGLDLKEFHDPDVDRLKRYWGGVQGMMTDVFASPLYTISRINGHAPAGGTVLSLATDHRIALNGPYKHGLNEAALGLVVPWWIEALMVRSVGLRQAERCIPLALLMGCDEALKIGLVDVVADGEDGLDEAVNVAVRQLKTVPAQARAAAKHQLRGEFASDMRARLEQDTDNFVATITSSDMQRALGAYLESLEKRKR